VDGFREKDQLAVDMENKNDKVDESMPTYWVDEPQEEQLDPLLQGRSSSKRAAIRSGFFAAAPTGDQGEESRLAELLGRIDQKRATQAANALRRIREVEEQAAARIERLEAIVSECRKRIEGREVEIAPLRAKIANAVQELERLSNERATHLRALGRARKDSITLQIERTKREVAELLDQQKELNQKRQLMFDEERRARGGFYSERVKFFREYAKRLNDARTLAEERAVNLGVSSAARGTTVVLTTLGMVAAYLAGEFFASMELGKNWGANSLLDHFLLRVTDFLDRFVSYDTVWKDLGILIGVWIGFLLGCHLLILGVDTLLERLATSKKVNGEKDDNGKGKGRDGSSIIQEGLSSLEISALGFSLRQDYGAPRRLYVLWLRSLPLLFVLGIILIVTARSSTLGDDQARLPAQLVGSTMTLLFASLALVLLTRLSGISKRAVRIMQAVWLAIAVLAIAAAAALFLGGWGGTAFMAALFVFANLVGAFAIGLALAQNDVADAANELDNRHKQAVEALAYWENPAAAGFLLQDHDVIRGGYTAGQSFFMNAIMDRIYRTAARYRKILRRKRDGETSGEEDNEVGSSTNNEAGKGTDQPNRGLSMSRDEQVLFPELHTEIELLSEQLEILQDRLKELLVELQERLTGTHKETEILLKRVAGFETVVKRIRTNTWHSAQALRRNAEELDRKLREELQDTQEGFTIGRSYWPGVAPIGPVEGTVQLG
jgi:hypothetical protein